MAAPESVTVGGVSFRGKDLEGVKLILMGLSDIAGNDAVAPILAALGLAASADRIFAISPHSTDPLAVVPKALLCTVAGDVVIRGTDSTPVTVPMVAGQILPMRARYVMAGTTATVVGLA